MIPLKISLTSSPVAASAQSDKNLLSSRADHVPCRAARGQTGEDGASSSSSGQLHIGVACWMTHLPGDMQTLALLHGRKRTAHHRTHIVTDLEAIPSGTWLFKVRLIAWVVWPSPPRASDRAVT